MRSRAVTCTAVALLALLLLRATRDRSLARPRVAHELQPQPEVGKSSPRRVRASAGLHRPPPPLPPPPPASSAPISSSSRCVGADCTFELVVCRYDEDVRWVSRLLGAATAPATAVIMNHGSPLDPAQLQSDRVVEWSAPNTGRECGCYLDHIERRWPDFAASTLYVQADSCCHNRVEQILLAAPPAHGFVSLTDKLYYVLKNGKQEAKYPGYNRRSCEMQALFGRQCNRSAKGGLWLGGPGLANFQVGRARLLRSERTVWRKARQLLDRWLVEADDAWVGCLPMERLWHVLLGEPDILPRGQALPHTATCDGVPKGRVCPAEKTRRLGK